MTTPTIAMTTGEAIVAVIAAGTALVLLVVWQLFGLARRGMELRADHDSRNGDAATRGER